MNDYTEPFSHWVNSGAKLCFVWRITWANSLLKIALQCRIEGWTCLKMLLFLTVSLVWNYRPTKGLCEILVTSAFLCPFACGWSALCLTVLVVFPVHEIWMCPCLSLRLSLYKERNSKTQAYGCVHLANLCLENRGDRPPACFQILAAIARWNWNVKHWSPAVHEAFL